jgi:hypothetical protein
MSEYIYLQGSESVQSAGNSISRAASEMSQTAGSIDSSLYNFKLFLDDWLCRLQCSLEEVKPKERPFPRRATYSGPKDSAPCIVHGFFSSQDGGLIDVIAVIEFDTGEIAQVNPSYLMMEPKP